MATTVSISLATFRQDSTILPVIDGVSELDAGFVKIHNWLYLPYFNIPLPFVPPNRTLKSVPVIMRDCFAPEWDFDTGVSSGVGANIQRTSGEGYDGAIYNTPLDADKCSIQAEITSITSSTGISLQDNSGTISHNYADATVAHSMTFGQNGQGSIQELGDYVENNAFFKYEVGDIGLIELDNGIVRYYLIKSGNIMQLLRTTRSKLTEAPKAEVLIYFTGGHLNAVLLNSDAEASTSFENIAVAYDNLNWQKWADQRTHITTGDALQLADNTTEYTYPNQKTTIYQYALNLLMNTRAEREQFEDFFRWHKMNTEFIYVDFARKDSVESLPTELWAKFASGMSDSTLNGCVYPGQVGIQECYRNDYIPRIDDLIAPEVEITGIESGSAIISGTASDNVMLVSLQLYQNGKPYGDTFLPDSDGNFEITVPTIDLIEGVNSFYVIATDYAGNTTQSATETYTLDTTPPSVPAGFSATKFSSSRIDSAWSAASDNVAVTGYELRRATNSGFSTGVTDIDVGNVTSYHNTGLSASTHYWYKVRAYDAEGNYSAYSTADDDTTDAPPPIVIEYDLDLQSYSNNDSVNNLVDSSGNAYHATGSSNKPVFKTDDGNYLNFVDGGGVINYLTIPDFTSLISSQAQLYIVIKVTAVTTRLGRFLGESNIAGAYTEVFASNLYEPFGTTVRKDNKIPVPLLNVGWSVYRVVSRSGYYDMSVNGTSFFNTSTNTFDKSHANPFILGYTANGCSMKVKYLAILNDNATDLVSALRTRFGI